MIYKNDLLAKFIPEIDGLRAYAVLSVIIFHNILNLLPGGFVGVDIFFVISGYVITGLLIKSIANNNFSITNFYNHRARRILPSLLIVLSVVLLFGSVFINGTKIYVADGGVHLSFYGGEYLAERGGSTFIMRHFIK